MLQADIPSLRLVYQATVDIAERQCLGQHPDGEHHIVPIVGGTFEGPGLRGVVLPGGADRQIWRADGVRELDALYDMRVDDGTVLTVRNRVLIEPLADGSRYARSVVRISAPAGPHAWMSRRVFVGTLNSLKPERQAVLVSVYLLE